MAMRIPEMYPDFFFASTSLERANDRLVEWRDIAYKNIEEGDKLRDEVKTLKASLDTLKAELEAAREQLNVPSEGVEQLEKENNNLRAKVLAYHGASEYFLGCENTSEKHPHYSGILRSLNAHTEKCSQHKV